jgi:hypothetical protein
MTREPLEQSIDHARSAELHLTAVRCYTSLKSKPESVPVDDWMKQDETPVNIYLPTKDIDGEIAFHTLAAQVHATLAVAAAQEQATRP